MKYLVTILSILFIPSDSSAQTVEDSTVAARVNGEPVTLLQVKRVMLGVLQGKSIPAEALPMVQAQSLEQAINRRLVVARLKAEKYEPTAAELQRAEENFDLNVSLAGLTREQYLKNRGLTEADLDEMRYWEIAGNRYAQDKLDDAALEEYFNQHRRDFDGTQLRVSHILWRSEGRPDPSEMRALLDVVKQVREEIVSGKLSFADAAAKYSVGPSRERSGDLGFIPRHEVMAEEFATAAFKLQKGEVSLPTISPFGVHLITVTDERPGTIPWTDLRDALKAAAQTKLFTDLAIELRKDAKVEYAGVLPHLDLTTGTLIPAGQ